MKRTNATTKLNDEYLHTFKRIELYIETKNFDNYTKENKLDEIRNKFFTAQKNGKAVTEITGADLEKFCKNFCSDYGTKNRITNIPHDLEAFFGILAITSIFDIIVYLFFRNTFHFSFVILAPLYIVIVYPIFALINITYRKLMFLIPQISKKLLKSTREFLMLTFIILTICFLDSHGTLFPMWIPAAFLTCSICYLVLYRIIKK